MKYQIHQIKIENFDAKTSIMLADDAADRIEKADDAMCNGYYVLVATIEAEDLNAVFEIGNMGPEEKISRHDSMHSISVGDVITNEDMTKSWVVAPIGFDPLPAYGVWK